MSKMVRGCWTDIVVSPYHALGTHATDVREGVAGAAAARRLRQLFDVNARHMGSEQFRHTCEEISVHNVLAWLHEIETGEPYAMRRDHDVYSGIDEGRRVARLAKAATADDQSKEDAKEKSEEKEEEGDEASAPGVAAGAAAAAGGGRLPVAEYTDDPVTADAAAKERERR